MSSNDQVNSATTKPDPSSNPAERQSATIKMPSNPSLEEYKREVNPAANEMRRKSLRETKPEGTVLQSVWETVTGRR
ncbi:hypothetical protein M433DRAFT_144998 [Acidomyces richmondensis BFW]|nr:hypothetical protein M433DRAFT_144998 [Acidomyces richmondensis BFW]